MTKWEEAKERWRYELETYGCSCEIDDENCPYRFVEWTDEDWKAAYPE